MAIQLPSSLYQAGNVVFDSTPSVKLYGDVLMKRQAKADALDEYDRRRINNINDQGVRDKDRQGFDQRLENIRGYYNTNKDKIRKGNTAEAYEYEKMFRDVSSYVNQSKERTAKQDAAMKFYQDRLKQDGVIPDDFMTELDINDKAIDEEGSTSFNLNKWIATSPKPFNPQTLAKEFSDIKRTPSIRTEPMKDNPLRITEITEETFDIPTKQVIAQRSANKYENSFSFREQVKTEFNDPVGRARLEQTFKDQFGTVPQRMEDYATAFTLELLQPKITKTKTIDNKDAIMTRRENMQREIQDRIDRRQAYGIAARRAYQVADQMAQDEYVDTMYETYKTKGTLDPQVVGDYQKSDGKGHKVPIDKTVFNPDGTVDFIVYKLDKKGNPTTEVDIAYSTKGVPANQLKARIRKELETPMTNTQQPIRAPKDIKNTKMAPKPTKPKPY